MSTTFGRYDPPSRPAPSFGFGSPSPVTRLLLIANLAIFALSFAIYIPSTETWDSIEGWLGLAPGLWRSLFPFVPIWQLGTYAFLHSTTALTHVLVNMLVLYFFGSMLESRLGGRRFLAVYAGAALAGALVFLTVELIVSGASGGAVAIGASGAVMGVLVACATLEPHHLVYLFPLPFPIRLRTLAVVLALLDFGNALLQVKHGGGGVAYTVHLGGMAYGWVAVRFRLIDMDPLAWWRGRRHEQEQLRARGEQERLDQLLQRIHERGLQSLTESEREFLKRVSKRR